MHKKINFILGILFFLIIIGAIGGGLYYFLKISGSDFLSNEKDGYTLQAVLFDKDGKMQDPSVLQTAVNGQSGYFYMALNLLASNTGNVRLTNLRMTESHPSEYTSSLQSANPMKSVLEVGESNVLEWNTANSCSTDANCGSSERCIYTEDILPAGKYCLIDISNFIGQITFGATLEADYVDAQGTTQTTSTIINLPFTFEQDEVVFRTNAVGESYNNGGVMIAVDGNDDGNLEAYTRYNGGLQAYNPADFIGYTMGDHLVFHCSPRVCVSYYVEDKNVADSFGATRFELGGTITTSKNPTEPYKSQNCGGLLPCQERYSIAVAPPEESCIDGILNQDEVCADVGGVCGNQESPEISCADSLDNDCDGLIDEDDDDCGATLEVAVRTNIDPSACINYESILTLPSGQDEWIAYDFDDDGNLEGYGKSGGACTSPDGTLPYDVPGGCNLQYDGSDLCIDYGGGYPRRYTTSYYEGNGELSSSPVEPYTSNNQEILA